jgi:hypothetical protein
MYKCTLCGDTLDFAGKGVSLILGAANEEVRALSERIIKLNRERHKLIQRRAEYNRILGGVKEEPKDDWSL